MTDTNEVVKRWLLLPWRKRHAVMVELDVLPVDWRERTDHETMLAAAAVIAARGCTIEQLERAIARVEEREGC